MGDEPRQRPKRRTAASRAAAQPSAAHYVGYVEDEETPESIARKFEELERIQSRLRDAAAANVAERPAGDGNDSEVGPMNQDELSEEQLMEVFQQTSSFTVSSGAKAYDTVRELLALLPTYIAIRAHQQKSIGASASSHADL